MKKNKILIYSMLLIAIILCIPSVLYLINNKTVDGFDSYYTYTLVKSDNLLVRRISGIVVIGLMLLFSIFYLFVIRKQKTIFQNKKQLFLWIMIISIIFTIILPFLSSDIFYYIGDSWLASKYKANPYYTTVKDLQDNGLNDGILNNTGYWKNTTSIYGPLWNSIATCLVSLSFGSITIALFIFKIASLLIHLLNCYLIGKITNNTKYVVLYGLNPLLLIEFLSNVHNDIYLILFILLAIYFLIRKKSIIFTIIFLALSVSIKYSTILIVPFILIYCFRNKSIPKRFLFCILSGLAIIAIVVVFYLPYYQDFSIFTNMLVQGSKYSQSILAFIMVKGSKNLFHTINELAIPVFIIIYATILIIMIFKRNIHLKELMVRYNYMMLIFIFLILTTFQKWYILWLLPTIIWQSKKMRKFILYLTITALVPSMDYFMVQGDPYMSGIGYSIKILILSTALLIMENLIKYAISLIREKKKYIPIE